VILIGGTRYAGEIKKSVFSVLNFLLPDRDILPMHCSANLGDKGDVALFFGLSGTGKTTLSADPGRALIGDDEHGWGPDGIFNFEGGCYAKAIRLTHEHEPQIYEAARQFGAILENVAVDPLSRVPDYDDDEITENTRASYPIHFIPNAVTSGRGSHPTHIFFLTCDAFGVLPPISLLGSHEVEYHFLSGYTAKVAGTERGVTEPAAVFSPCFGEPFLPRPAEVYGSLLLERIREHGSRVWLVNTGWTAGSYGVGRRIRLRDTRNMIRAALDGRLDGVGFTPEAAFGLQVPSSVPDVPTEILRPRSTWEDPERYDETARKVAGMFEVNYRRFRGRDGEE
jgi:phosphoenolpyruvate carboxykinase (ATP)